MIGFQFIDNIGDKSSISLLEDNLKSFLVSTSFAKRFFITAQWFSTQKVLSHKKLLVNKTTSALYRLSYCLLFLLKTSS